MLHGPPSLPDRLARMLEMVPPRSRVADVGSDHGLLATSLLWTSRATWCVATERDAGRLAALARAVAAGDPSLGLELRSGFGLEPLRPDDRIDVVVLGGLGTATALRILDPAELARLATLRRVIVQPQTDPGGLRRGLRQRGFAIVDEALVASGVREHLVLAAEPSAGADPPHPILSPEDLLEAGPCLVRSQDPAVERYWRREAARLDRILRRAASPAARRRRELADRVLSALGSCNPG